MGYKDMVNMDEIQIEKFQKELLDGIQKNKENFCESMRGLKKLRDKMSNRKPKWINRFIQNTDWFGDTFYNQIKSYIDFFKSRIKYGLTENLNENIFLKKEYFSALKDSISYLLHDANDQLNICKRRKTQIQIETYPEIEVEIPIYEHHSDNFYSEDLPEIKDFEESILDTKYYLNMFLDVLIENLAEMIEKIKNEMLKFETQTINKSSSMYNSLLKLSFEFRKQINS